MARVQDMGGTRHTLAGRSSGVCTRPLVGWGETQTAGFGENSGGGLGAAPPLATTWTWPSSSSQGYISQAKRIAHILFNGLLA